MTRNPKTIAAHQLAAEGLKVLSEHHIDQLIVVNEDHKPIGLLDIQELVTLFQTPSVLSPQIL